jgi:hypothetical protein
MMNDELAAIAGKYEEVVGRLQEGYGKAREEAWGEAARYRVAAARLKKAEQRLRELQDSMIGRKKRDRTGRTNPGRRTKSR